MKLSSHIKIGLTNIRFALLARTRPYKEFHRELMNHMASVDAKSAVGGQWEQMGELQLDYLRNHGLTSCHKLLDFGCGSLRAGRHFIRFLDEKNYYGIDISSNLIEVGKGFLANEGLLDKQPVLIVNEDLQFEELEGIQFDYIIAHSVFSHMPLDDIEECFQNLHKIIASTGVFFATYHDGGRSEYRRGLFGEQFYYPFSFFEGLGEKYGYQVAQMADFHHPKNQTMMKITRKPASRRLSVPD